MKTKAIARLAAFVLAFAPLCGLGYYEKNWVETPPISDGLKFVVLGIPDDSNGLSASVYPVDKTIVNAIIPREVDFVWHIIERETVYDEESHEFLSPIVNETYETISVPVRMINGFSNCASLQSVTIPNSITNIGYSAFMGCSSLTSVTIPDSVTRIESQAFANCSSLTRATTGNSVTSIEDKTFMGCSSLTSVTIGNRVTSIGYYAFYNCSSLTEVYIPASVTDIDYTAFNLCEKLQRFIVAEDNPAYASVDGVLCSKDLKTLVVYLRGRVDARLPEGLEEAMPDAFAGCNKLWMEWCKRINTIPYDLTNKMEDRAIATLTVDRDTALDGFVLKDGKAYDAVIYISNISSGNIRLTLPSGYAYKCFKGANPLTIPSNSQCILSITRVADSVFLVSREELETVR